MTIGITKISYIAMFISIMSTVALAESKDKNCPTAPQLGFPSGSVLSRISDDKKLKETSNGELFRVASGFYCDWTGNFPAIYAHIDGLTVIGPSFERKFSFNELKDAISTYKTLLIIQDYITPSSR